MSESINRAIEIIELKKRVGIIKVSEAFLFNEDNHFGNIIKSFDIRIIEAYAEICPTFITYRAICKYFDIVDEGSLVPQYNFTCNKSDIGFKYELNKVGNDS